MVDASAHNLRSVRLLTLAVIIGLVLSGLTAFPLQWELDVLSRTLVGQGSLDPGDHHGLARWILKVREGLSRSYEAYPFLAYGTDWLAFEHLVIALFFTRYASTRCGIEPTSGWALSPVWPSSWWRSSVGRSEASRSIGS